MTSLLINTSHRMNIYKSQAWKDTQRILKRSGLVYRGERSELPDPGEHFNRYTMRYLCLLNIITLKVRSVSKFSCQTEVGQCHRMAGKYLSLNTPPFVLVPHSIRRKVDGFRQPKGKTTPKSAQPSTDSLYGVSSEENDSAKLDVRIVKLPLSLQEGGKEISVMGSSPWAVARPVLRSASPVLELFYQKYQPLRLKSVFKFKPEFKQLLTRLSFRKQSVPKKQQYRVKSQSLKRLGNMLFFTSPYNQGCLEEFIDAPVEKGDIYLEMPPGGEKVKTHQKMVNYVEAFCNKMMEEYLIPTASRHYKKKRIARNESSES